MVRPLGLAAFGAFGMRRGGQRVMGPAHIAARRRGFSFGHRHGGKLLQGPPYIHAGGQQRGVGSGKMAGIQAKSPRTGGITEGVSTL